jgi:hypothetical protein
MTEQELDQLEKIQEMQQKSLEGMTKSLPSISGFMELMMGAANKIEKIKKERSDIVHALTEDLEAKVEEVLILIDEDKKSRAKLKALSIKWTPIGDINIDQERTKHFDDLREEVLKVILES